MLILKVLLESISGSIEVELVLELAGTKFARIACVSSLWSLIKMLQYELTLRCSTMCFK